MAQDVERRVRNNQTQVPEFVAVAQDIRHWRLSFPETAESIPDAM